MSPYLRPATAMLRVEDADGSAGFYALLGFEVAERREEDGRLVWARLVAGEAELVLVEERGGVRTNPGEAAVLCLYPSDVAALHSALQEHEVPVGPLQEADGSVEFDLVDPDGYELRLGGAAS